MHKEYSQKRLKVPQLQSFMIFEVQMYVSVVNYSIYEIVNGKSPDRSLQGK